MEDELLQYEELACETQTGWWIAYIDKKIFKCSKFISEILGIEKNTFTFDYFINRISPEYRKVITEDLLDYNSEQSEYFRTMYSIDSPKGNIWVAAHTSPKIKLDTGEVIRKGSIRIIDPPQEEKEPLIITKVNDLIQGLNSISKTLKNLLTDKNSDETVNKILAEILKMYKGDRSYVFLFEDNYKYQSCKYEVNKAGVSPEKDRLQKISSESISWWTAKMLNKDSIILDDIMKLPETAQPEFEMLKAQDIQSVMIVPLIGEDEVLGYMGIDIVKRHYNWTKEDYQWLLTMANIISIFMTMRTKQEKLNEEQHKLSDVNKSLKKSEEKMKKVFENIPISAGYYNINGEPLQYNNKCLDIFGLSSVDDAKGYSYRDDPNVLPSLYDAMKNKEFIEYNLEYNFDKVHNLYKTWRTGTTNIYVKATKLHDENGDYSGYLIAFIENGDKMMTFNRIHDFESFFSIISESAKIGYAKINLANNKGYAIKQWYNNVGEDENESLAQVISQYKHFHPDDRKDIFKFYNDVREGKAKTFSREVRVHIPGQPLGKWNWLYKNLVVTRYAPEAGDIEVIGVNYDITELKDTAAELKKARDRAEEMDKLKMAFVANMSHEIRTPLNSIIGFADLLAYSDNNADKKTYINPLAELKR